MIVREERVVPVSAPVHIATCDNCGQTEEVQIDRAKVWFKDTTLGDYPRGWLVLSAQKAEAPRAPLGFCRWLCVAEFAQSKVIEQSGGS